MQTSDARPSPDRSLTARGSTATVPSVRPLGDGPADHGRRAIMKITGVRTRLYEFTAGRGLGDANLPTGSDRGNGLAVFVDTDEGITGVTTGSPGARAAIHGLAESLLVGQDPRGVRGLWKRMVDAVFKGG